MILLDARVFVIDIQRRGHIPRHHAGPEPRARGPRDPAIEDELDFLRAAQVEVFADHLLEEQPTVRSAPVKGCGNSRNHLRSRASILAAERPSQIACKRLGSAHVRMPLSSASKAMPSFANWRLAYSWPFRQSLALKGK